MPKRKGGRKYGQVFGPNGLTRAVCKWCGSEKRSQAEPGGVRGNSGGSMKRVCANPDCPRKGQVPWAVPVMMPIPQRMRRQRPDRDEEDCSPGQENAIRAMEDGLGD